MASYPEMIGALRTGINASGQVVGQSYTLEGGIDVNSVPEPTTLAMMSSALVIGGFIIRRRRQSFSLEGWYGTRKVPRDLAMGCLGTRGMGGADFRPAVAGSKGSFDNREQISEGQRLPL